MRRFVIAHMEMEGVPVAVGALVEDGRIYDLAIGEQDDPSILGNIYVGRVDSISQNIQAAFIRIAPELNGYFPLEEEKDLIYTGKKDGTALKVGDEVLVQVSRDAMKGKLPRLSANLTITGQYVVLTSGDRSFGLSRKLEAEERRRLAGFFQDEIGRPDKEFGTIVRTNAADAKEEDILEEFSRLKERYHNAVVLGRHRTIYSRVYSPEPFYIEMLQGIRHRELDEVVTDMPSCLQHLQEGGAVQLPENTALRFYDDKLLPLYKLYAIEQAIDEACREKVWLKSGGFLMIEQTEAFVSIDVNTGKNISGKKAEETFRKINLEAAGEIARQIRLRNLSGIILTDFINLSNPDHLDELYHVLKKALRKDPIRAVAVDITPLNIFEMTRKKKRRPLIEDINRIRCAGHE